MLSFDSRLSDALKLGNTTAFWVLKLYYNADATATNFIGVSDIHRVDGSDIYYGLVSSWGNYSQSLDFFNFTTSTGNMSIRLINTDKSIQGGRFSDLFSTNNFANRKWELFLNTNQAGTYDTAARMIGTGIISGDIGYDYESVKLTLLDLGSKHHKRIPKNVVTSATYTNAPQKNIEKPIPISFGDSHDRTDIGTIPTSGANFDRHFTKGKFPAIITNEWDETNARTDALVDSVAVHTLDTENVFMSIGEKYGACNSSNVTESEANFKITALGTDWRVYAPVQKHSTYSGGTNYSNMMNNSFSGTGYILAQSGSGATSVGFRIGKLPNLGVLTAAYLLIDFGTFTGGAPNVNFKVSPGSGAGGAITDTITWSGGDQTLTVTALFSTDEQTAWDIEREFFLTIDNTGAVGSRQVSINEVGLEFKVEPSQTFEHRLGEIEEIKGSRHVSELYDKSHNAGQTIETTKRIVRTRTLSSPASVDYLYYSGKGRKYGAWIDTIDGNDRTDENEGEPDPNYATTDYIENPVYMIEEILRTELSLDSSTDGSDIDLESFDRSGNGQTDSTKGDIAFTFNDAIADIKFAFSQYKFIDSQDFIEKICRQICSWVWISGDGKFKIRTLLRPTDTWAEDKTVDFNDINLKSISKTALNNVRNNITVNYNYDYVKEESLDHSTSATDSTSQGTTVSGYNVSGGLSLIMDGDTLDSTTANQMADAYVEIFKDRKVILGFDCIRPLYNDLEITDIITFSNWDSNLKLYGTAFSSDYFIVSDISKRPDGCSIKAIKVD